MAEHGNEFGLWLPKLVKLAQEPKVNLLSHCKGAFLTSLAKIRERKDWEDFFLFFKNIQTEDLMVLIAVWKGLPSPMCILD